MDGPHPSTRDGVGDGTHWETWPHLRISANWPQGPASAVLVMKRGRFVPVVASDPEEDDQHSRLLGWFDFERPMPETSHCERRERYLCEVAELERGMQSPSHNPQGPHAWLYTWSPTRPYHRPKRYRDVGVLDLNLIEARCPFWRRVDLEQYKANQIRYQPPVRSRS